MKSLSKSIKPKLQNLSYTMNRLSAKIVATSGLTTRKFAPPRRVNRLSVQISNEIFK